MDQGRVDTVFLRGCAVQAPDDWAGWARDLAELAQAQWSEVIRHAEAHGLVGMLARSLTWAAAISGGCTAAAAERLESMRRGQLVQQLHRKSSARAVAEAFGRAGIEFIALKGISLAEEIYGDLSLRGFRDFDVLVRPERADDAFTVLLGLGYREPPFGGASQWRSHGAHAVGLSHADGSGVDLHWAIAPDLVEPRHMALVWEHARPAPRGAHLPGLRLSPEMTLLHLAKHFHSHQYGNLKVLVDFHVAARRAGASLDVPMLESVARALGVLHAVDVAVALSERSLMPGALPAPLRGRASSSAGRRAARVLGDRFLVRSASMPRLFNWARYLACAGNARATLRGIVDILVPGKLALTQFFNRPFEPRMYPRYYWRQLRKVVTLSNR